MRKRINGPSIEEQRGSRSSSTRRNHGFRQALDNLRTALPPASQTLQSFVERREATFTGPSPIHRRLRARRGRSLGALLGGGPPTPSLANLIVDDKGFGWYLVATNDEAIPPDAERQFAQRMGATTAEVPSSHLRDGLPPDDVMRLIQAAAAQAVGSRAADDTMTTGV